MKRNSLSSNHKPPLLIRGYLFSRFWLGNGLSFVKACFAGFWLGVLSQKQLLLASEYIYDHDCMYRDEEYIMRGLFSWEQMAVHRYFKGCKRLLLIGAGTGREVLALMRQGYQVDGFECNARLREHANGLLARNGFAPGIQPAAPNTCPDTGRKYDGLIVGWGAYTHVRPRETRTAFLKGLRTLVDAGAPILLSFVTRSGRGPRYRIIAAIANTLRWLLRRDRIEIGDDLDPHPGRAFTESEIDGELREGGFALAFYSTQLYGGHAVGLASES